MAVANKDQERVGYAWMYGAQARKDGKERTVPEYWLEHAEARFRRGANCRDRQTQGG
jgi:hypothetical protein